MGNWPLFRLGNFQYVTLPYITRGYLQHLQLNFFLYHMVIAGWFPSSVGLLKQVSFQVLRYDSTYDWMCHSKCRIPQVSIYHVDRISTSKIFGLSDIIKSLCSDWIPVFGSCQRPQRKSHPLLLPSHTASSGSKLGRCFLVGSSARVSQASWVTTAVGFSGCFMDFSDDPKMVVGFHQHSQMFWWF